MVGQGRPVVILFVKAPVIGAVKTRLAADIGAVAAWRFYRHTVQNVGRRLHRRRGQRRPWRLVLAVTPDRAHRDVSAGFPALRDWPTLPQGHGDIGTRMLRCLAHFQPAPTILIGGDIPGVTGEIIEQSFNKLATAEIILGAAADGGFWLIGRRGHVFPAGLFEGVQWSGDSVLKQVVNNVPRHLRLSCAQTLADVDRAADLTAAAVATLP